VPSAQGTLAGDQWRVHHTSGFIAGTDTRRIHAEESGPMTEIRASDLHGFLSLALPFACMTLGVSSARLFAEPPDFSV
jgi:hypothetical protein